MPSVYLIHFDPPYKHAQHYAGWTSRDDVGERIEEHRSGRGARLCAVAAAAGCKLLLARVWEGVPRKHERKIKARTLKPHCPICQELEYGERTEHRGS